MFEDYLTPDTLYALEQGATAARAVRSLPAQFDSSPYVSEQYEAVSRDGTRMPYFVLRRRDMPLNGQNPTLLYAYGGFQVSMTPGYSPNVGKLWLDRGGVYVIANIRGGGEFGPPGTKLACAPIAKSSTTISTPLSAIWWSAASPRRAVSASWAARMAAC